MSALPLELTGLGRSLAPSRARARANTRNPFHDQDNEEVKTLTKA